jgi:hypothetical protein
MWTVNAAIPTDNDGLAATTDRQSANMVQRYAAESHGG